MGSRRYDPELGRFIQADTKVPKILGTQGWDRYAGMGNNPVKYVDPDGHVPVIPILIAAGVILLKAIDYGWTAYDAYKCTQILTDPNASQSEKEMAATDLAMAAAFEAIEPDDALPVSLPIDDLARKGLIKVGKEVGEEASAKAFKTFNKDNFRPNLQILTGRSSDYIKGKQAHHILPQKFEDKFSMLGLDIHDPKFGAWVDGTTHGSWSWQYNKQWEEFLDTKPTQEDVLDFAKELAEQYGYDTYFD
jgi:hypothetical protein